MSPERILPLERVVEALRGLERYGPPAEREAFLQDPALQKAVQVRMGLLAGHAADLPEALLEDHPELPWQRFRALQDALARYGTGEPERAWTFLVNPLPELLRGVEGLLEALRASRLREGDTAGPGAPPAPGTGPRDGLVLRLLPGAVAVVQLAPDGPLPAWFSDPSGDVGSLRALVRTARELTLYLPEDHLPPEVDARRGFRVMELEGPLPFDAVGVLRGLLDPLARNGVPILALSTHNTDLLLIHQEDLARALSSLREAGIPVRGEQGQEPRA